MRASPGLRVLVGYDLPHLPRCLGSLIEDLARVWIGIEWFSFHDSQRGQHAAPIGIGNGVDWFAVNKSLRYFKGAGVLRPDHVRRLRGCVRELHRLGAVLFAKRIYFGLRDEFVRRP